MKIRSFLLSFLIAIVYIVDALGAGYPEVKELWRTTLPKAATSYYVEAVGEDGAWLISTYAPDFYAWISSSGVLLDTFDKSPPVDDIDVISISSADVSYLLGDSLVQKTVNSSGVVSTLKTLLSGVGRSQFGTSTPEKRNPFLVFQGNTVICYHVSNAGASNPLTGGISNYIRIRTNPLDQYVVAGGSAELKADVANSIPVTYQWQKDGKDLAGAALTNLRIDKIATINSGAYALVVKSAFGSLTSSPARLEVVAPPIVSFDSYDLTGKSGQIITLTPAVVSSGPIAYRWFKDGLTIVGETGASLVLTPTSPKGLFQVEARNLAGSVLSKNVSFIPAPVSIGTKKWDFTTGFSIKSSPAIDSDGTVYIGSQDHKVYALDGVTGRKKWEFLTGGSVASTPAISSDGFVFVGSDDQKLYALNGATGVKKWDFITGDSPYIIGSSPAIGPDGTIYIGSGVGKVYALYGTSGTKKWEFLTEGMVWSSPGIGSDGTVYVGSGDKKVYAINGANGTKKWELLTGGAVESSPAIGSDGTVYAGSKDGKLYAINGSSGTKKWEFPIEGSSIAIGSDGAIYMFTRKDGKLYALDGATGVNKWQFPTLFGWFSGTYSTSSPAIGLDGTVYVGGFDAKVYAIVSGSVGLAKSPWPKFRGNNQNTGRVAAGFGPLSIGYSNPLGINLSIPVSPDLDTILEYSTNLNQWSEQQRFSRQSNTQSIVVPLKMDQTKAMEYWRTRNQ